MFIVILAPAKTLFTKASEIFSPPFLSFSVWLWLDLFLGSNKQFKIIQENYPTLINEKGAVPEIGQPFFHIMNSFLVLSYVLLNLFHLLKRRHLLIR